MKSLFNFLSIALLACTVLLSTSCKDDDGPVIDPGTGLNLADGFYLAASGSDPVSSAGLSSESVEDEGFASQDRSGFVAGYLYLSAGDYNLVSVTAKEVTETIGGTATAESDMGSGCDFNDYTLISTAANGPAFNVATEGLYKVTYDALSKEIILYQIVQAGIIGSATPNGWGADTPLSGSVTATGGSFTISDVVLRQGEFKVRFNCRWNLDRRVDPAAGFGMDNGYQLFTNFGGSTNDLLPGNDGANIQLLLANEGIYTIDLTWSPSDDWSISLTKTGEAPVITFDPNNFKWGVIGDATASSWDADQNMFYKGEVGGAHTWLGVVTLAGTGEFKFRANDDWDINLGGTLPTDGSEVSLDLGGSNVPTPGAGQYFLTVKTADEGASWTASVVANGWGIIGSATPTGWDSDTDMVAAGFVDGVTTYTITDSFVAGEYKFRANDGWDYNIGGDAAALSADGDNLMIAADGTYTVTLSYDGETYSVDVQ